MVLFVYYAQGASGKGTLPKYVLKGAAREYGMLAGSLGARLSPPKGWKHDHHGVLRTSSHCGTSKETEGEIRLTYVQFQLHMGAFFSPSPEMACSLVVPCLTAHLKRWLNFHGGRSDACG